MQELGMYSKAPYQTITYQTITVTITLPSRWVKHRARQTGTVLSAQTGARGRILEVKGSEIYPCILHMLGFDPMTPHYIFAVALPYQNWLFS